MLVNQKNETLYTIGCSWSRVKKKFQQLMCLPHPGLMHHRTLFDNYGMFDADFKISGDYDFLLRELSHSDALFIEGFVVAGMQEGGISNHPSQSLRSLKEVRCSHRKLGRYREGWEWWVA